VGNIKFTNKDDSEINSALSYLDNIFINGSNPNDFKKIDIFKNIRNALNHSNINDLFVVNFDGSITVNLRDKNFNIKITPEEMINLSNTVDFYSSYSSVYSIKNQEKINAHNLISSQEKCVQELENITIIRTQKDKKTTNKKYKNLDLLIDKDLKNAHKTIDESKKISSFEFNLSKEQIETLAFKITSLKNVLPMDIFYCPIIFNSMASGLFKTENLFLDNMITKEYLYDWDNKYYDIGKNILMHLNNFHSNNISDKNIFKKYKFQDYGPENNGILYKYVPLYIFDSDKNCANDMLYFTYAFNNIYFDGLINNSSLSDEYRHIRNALSHKRYFHYITEETDSIYLYDNFNDILHPVQTGEEKWNKTIEINEFYKIADNLVSCYSDRHHEDNER